MNIWSLLLRFIWSLTLAAKCSSFRWLRKPLIILCKCYSVNMAHIVQSVITVLQFSLCCSVVQHNQLSNFNLQNVSLNCLDFDYFRLFGYSYRITALLSNWILTITGFPDIKILRDFQADRKSSNNLNTRFQPFQTQITQCSYLLPAYCKIVKNYTALLCNIIFRLWAIKLGLRQCSIILLFTRKYFK